MNLVDIMYNEIMGHLMLIILVINGNQNDRFSYPSYDAKHRLVFVTPASAKTKISLHKYC